MNPFTKIPNYVVFNSEDLDVYEFRIFIVLLSLNPKYPSYKNLENWTGISRNKVRKALNGLRDKGRISWVSGNSFGKNNRYKILSMRKMLVNSDFDNLISTRDADSRIIEELGDYAPTEPYLGSGEGN